MRAKFAGVHSFVYSSIELHISLMHTHTRAQITLDSNTFCHLCGVCAAIREPRRLSADRLSSLKRTDGVGGFSPSIRAVSLSNSGAKTLLCVFPTAPHITSGCISRMCIRCLRARTLTLTHNRAGVHRSYAMCVNVPVRA